MSVAILGFLGNGVVKGTQEQKQKSSGDEPPPAELKQCGGYCCSLQDEPRQTRRAQISLEVPKVSSGMSSEEQ